MLKAKAALITGSTRGIGLGMAETLAKKGCNIMLNGFGDAGEITRLQKGIAAENGVQVFYYGADVGEPKEIEAKQPSKAFVTIQQLAELTAFLCSDNAAQITGTLIAVDGGWSAQ